MESIFLSLLFLYSAIQLNWVELIIYPFEKFISNLIFYIIENELRRIAIALHYIVFGLHCIWIALHWIASSITLHWIHPIALSWVHYISNLFSQDFVSVKIKMLNFLDEQFKLDVDVSCFEHNYFSTTTLRVSILKLYVCVYIFKYWNIEMTQLTTQLNAIEIDSWAKNF